MFEEWLLEDELLAQSEKKLVKIMLDLLAGPLRPELDLEGGFELLKVLG